MDAETVAETGASAKQNGTRAGECGHAGVSPPRRFKGAWVLQPEGKRRLEALGRGIRG